MLRRSTLIVLIAFLLLVGVVVYLQYADRNPGSAAESTPNADFLTGGEDTASSVNATVQAFEDLFDFDSNAVTGLRVVAADGRTLVMEKNEAGAFVLTEPQTPVEFTDAPRIFQTIDALSRVEVAFDMGQVALSAVGLDDPAYQVTFTLEDGTQVDLLVGDLTPPQTGYYVQLPGDTPKAVGKTAIDDLLAFFVDPPVVPTPTPEPQEAE